MRILNKRDYHYFMEADLGSAGLHKWKWHYRFQRDTLHFIRVLRWAEYLTNCKQGHFARLRLLYAKWRLRRLGRTLGLEIPVNVFGPGLSIVHPCGIVVSRHATVGRNCRIHAGVNIGEHRCRAPKIADNVYLGPGAKIVGGVTVGFAAVVGANAVVVNDVLPNTTVGGVPAKKLSNQDSSYLITAAESARQEEPSGKLAVGHKMQHAAEAYSADESVDLNRCQAMEANPLGIEIAE